MSRARRIGSLMAATCALAGATAAATPAAQADPAQPLVTVEAGAERGIGSGDLAAGADGALWSLTASTVERRATGGSFTSAPLPTLPGTSVKRRIGLQQLADGGMAAVVAYESGYRWRGRVHEVAVVRVAADGRGVHRVFLPQTARRAHGFAIEPDGTVWWARACEDELHRRDVSGRVTVLRLRRMGCGDARDAELASVVAVDPNGTTWLVNACQGRVVRLGADGRRLERRWRAEPCWEDDMYGVRISAEAAVDPRGGIVFSGGGQESEAGRVDAAGDVTLAASYYAVQAFAPDGSLWRSDGTVVRPGGADVKVFAGGDRVVPARGGGAWALNAEWRSDGYGRHAYSWRVNPNLTLAADVSAAAQPLTPLVSAPEERISFGSAAVGPDGALWFGVNGKLVRAMPAATPVQAAPRATGTRVLARRGRTVTLQLACAAEIGRWCTGSVRLGGTDRAERFAIAGGWRGAVRVELGAADARALRRGRAVRTTAVVRSAGAGETRRALTLRPQR